jgi:hypothetical protein
VVPHVGERIGDRDQDGGVLFVREQGDRGKAAAARTKYRDSNVTTRAGAIDTLAIIAAK